MAKAVNDRFEQRKLTRKLLIEAAQKLFSTSGYEHATVDDIAQAAGYSKGAYYFHFSTKDDILLELLRMWTEDRARVLAAAVEAEGSGAEVVHDVLESLLSYKDSPQWPGVLLEFWSQAMRNAEVSKRMSQAYAGWRKQIAGAFERAAADGSLRVASAEDAATVALAAHDGYAVQLAVGAPGGRALTPAGVAASILAPLEPAAEAPDRKTIAL